MDSLFTFGPYAGYIWFAYGASALGLGALTLFTWRAYASAKRRARALEDGTAK
jgi:heme exporter protein CcmD